MRGLYEEFDVEIAIDAVVSSRTEKERERWQKFQDEQRAKLSQINHRAEFGRRLVESALTETIEGENQDKLAEGYAYLGDYAKAAQTASNASKRAEYEKILEAINIPDEVVCGCEKEQKGVQTVGKPKSITFPTFFLKDKIYTLGGEKELYCCSLCGFLNATTPR